MASSLRYMVTPDAPLPMFLLGGQPVTAVWQEHKYDPKASGLSFLMKHTFCFQSVNLVRPRCHCLFGVQHLFFFILLYCFNKASEGSVLFTFVQVRHLVVL